MSLEEEINSSSYADSQESQTIDLSADTENLTVNSNNQANNNSKYAKNEALFDDRKNTVQNTDKDFYEEILEKLDIKPKSKKEELNDKLDENKAKTKNDLAQKQNSKKNAISQKLEKSMTQDLSIIQKLVKNGLINSEQGQNLKKQVLKKTFDKIVQTEKVKRNLASSLKRGKTQVGNDNSQNFENSSQNNSNFFNSSGRNEVLNYLKSSGVTLGKDDLGKISDIVRIVEKSAIDRFLQKAAHEKSLITSNENAKQRLTANAQNQGHHTNVPRTFTREQIGKMSGAEFAKYESSIMEALKKGQIK